MACLSLIAGPVDAQAGLRQLDPALSVQNGHSVIVQTVAFAPDGRVFATGSFDKTIKLWNAEGALLHTLAAHDFWVRMVAFAPDGSMLVSSSDDRTIKFWNPDGSLIRSVTDDSQVHAVGFSPDAGLLASASANGTVRLWTAAGNPLRTLSGPTGAMALAVVFAPDGRTLASASTDRLIRIWSVDGRLLRSLRMPSGYGTALAFSPDGRFLLAGGDEGLLTHWDRAGRLVSSWRAHSARVTALTFADDGNLASAGQDGSVMLWKERGGHRGAPFLLRRSGNGGVLSAAFAPGGRSIVLGTGTGIEIRARDGRLLRLLGVRTARVNHLRFSPDGGSIVYVVGEEIRRATRDWVPLRNVRTHRSYVESIAFSGDGSLILSGSRDDTIRLWDPEWEPAGSIQAQQGGVGAVAISPDNTIIASGSAFADGSVRLWRRDGTPLRTILGFPRAVTNISFAPDGGSFLTTSATVQIWDLHGKLLQTMAGTGPAFYSADGRSIIVGGSRELTVWPVLAKGSADSVRRQIPGPRNTMPGVLQSLCHSSRPGGHLLLVTGKDQARTFFDLQGNPMSLAAAGDLSRCDGVLSPDGRLYLGSSYYAEGIRVEDNASLTKVADVLPLTDGSLLTILPSNHYRLSGPTAIHAIAFRKGMQAYAFDQFDLRFNRPDLVVAGLNSPDEIAKDASLRQKIARYKAYWEYRVKQNGFRPEDIAGQKEIHAPEVTNIAIDGLPRDPPRLGRGKYGRSAPSETRKRQVELSFQVQDEAASGLPIIGYRIFVNGVPVDGQYIKREEPAKVLMVRRTVTLSARGSRPADAQGLGELSQGENHIEISGMTSDGVESNRESVYVRYTGPDLKKKPNLYVITLGVDAYSSGSGFSNLKLAVKDARDLSGVLSNQRGVFGRIVRQTYANAQVNRARIQELAWLLRRTGVDDTVLVFLSGHGYRALTPTREANGMLELSYGASLPSTLRYTAPANIFYYMTGDSSAKAPWERAVPLDMIRMMLDGIPARQKVLMIDACNSGEDTTSVGSEPSQFAQEEAGKQLALLEKSDPQRSRSWTRGEGDARGVKLRIAASIDQREMAELFPELRRGNGTIEISASTASQSAYEDNRWGNGAFTYALKQGIAKTRKDGRVYAGALRKYVFENVGPLTGGRQQPMVARDLAGRDFVLVQAGAR